MDDQTATWVPLMVESYGRGRLGSRQAMGGPQLDMLMIEGELIAKGIPAVFHPRRPGEFFGAEGDGEPTQLLVRQRDLREAQEIRDALIDGEDAPAS